MAIYGYTRVSTRAQLDGNSLEDQRAAILEQYPTAEIISEQYSGAKDCPQLLDLMSRMQAGDTLVITKLDRLCRTARTGMDYIADLKERAIKVHILNMGLIESTPVGDLITTCLLAFAEFERSQIIERTKAGREIARQKAGYRDGRPRKYSRKQIAHALELLETHSYKQTEEMTGISVSTLQRAKRERNKRSAAVTYEEDSA